MKRLLFVSVVVALVLAACAQPTPEVVTKEVVAEKEVTKEVVVEKEVTVPPEPVTISVAYWASEAHMIGMNEVVKAFAAKHPNIIMEVVVPPPADYFPKLLSMYAAGQGPDILYTPGYWFPYFVKKGVIRDVEGYIARDGWDTSIYYPQVLESFAHEGKVYGIPWVWATNLIFWNKDLFDELGVPYPGTSLDDESWTWDKFVEVAKQLTTKTDAGEPNTFGFSLPVTHWSVPHIFPWEAGGGVLSEDMTKCIFNSPESVQALQWLVDLDKVHQVLPTVLKDVGLPTFQTGRYGMQLDAAPSMSSWWRVAEFEWDVAHIPIGPVKQACTLSPEAFVMSSTTAHPNEAWEVLKFLGGAEAQEIQARSPRSMPAVVSIAEGDVFLPPDKPPAHKEVLWESLEYARQPLYPPFWQDMRVMIGNELQAAFYEGKPVQEVADDVCAQIEVMIAEAAEE